MSAVIAPVREEHIPAVQEDLARADLYALIARLLYSPDRQLLRAIAAAGEIGAETADAPLARAWRALAAAAEACDAETVNEEYENVFIGVGRPEVMLFGSYYLAGFMMEKPLALLRDDLAQMGLARSESVREPEDHLAALCDVMRHLILADENRDTAGLEQQKRFFTRHIQTWYQPFCDAVLESKSANFYKHVARLIRVFFRIETESFEML
ncbi:MAG TPA: molecular chaperone TorD family protein [Burkholderiales bacterium]|nr:molecular chaperone TorD family protein [Burkholderiales bacterium]